MLDGVAVTTAQEPEYANWYAHFADLVRHGRSDVDCSALQLVADAFLCARRVDVAAFIE